MLTGTAATSRAIQGNLPDEKNLRWEPLDHAIGKSRGELTAKIHCRADGKQRALVVQIGPGQWWGSLMSGNLLDVFKVRHPATGATRRRSVQAIADTAHSSPGNRKYPATAESDA